MDLFWKTWLKELNHFWVWLKELNLVFEKWPIELNLFMNFFQYDSKNWTFTMTQRFQFLTKVDAKNRTFSLNMTRRIGLFFRLRILPIFERDSKIWTYFSNMTQRIEPIFSVTQRILIWFFQNFFDSKNLFLESMTQRNEPDFFFQIWHKELNLFMTRGIWPFLFNLNQRIEPFFYTVWLKELNIFYEHDSKILFFEYDSRNCFFHYDSKNWLNLFHMTLKTVLKIWLKELNAFWKCDSKNWTLFWKCNSKNWTLFWKCDSK